MAVSFERAASVPAKPAECVNSFVPLRAQRRVGKVRPGEDTGQVTLAVSRLAIADDIGIGEVIPGCGKIAAARSETDDLSARVPKGKKGRVCGHGKGCTRLKNGGAANDPTRRNASHQTTATIQAG